MVKKGYHFKVSKGFLHLMIEYILNGQSCHMDTQTNVVFCLKTTTPKETTGKRFVISGSFPT